MDPNSIPIISEFIKNVMRETIAGGYLILLTIVVTVLYKKMSTIYELYINEVEEHKNSIKKCTSKYEDVLEKTLKMADALGDTLEKTLAALEENLDD